ncbi:MAG: hypothetical protein Q9184_001694 [Pyrenodesmia sp. 2 TL-2023]
MRCTKNTTSSDDSSDSDSSAESFSSDPPPSPYRWMWYCHQCRTGYELGVTRRCLIDDHQLCYGQPVKKRSKKGKKKHQACQSEFDYVGWQNWGAWKRLGTRSEEEPVQRNCSARCDWPSQCRWARKEERSVESKSNESVPAAAPEAVQEPPREAAQEDAPPTEETPAPACNENNTTQPQKSTESSLISIATAARQFTSRWTSLLAPIPEEEPASASIESFLNSHKIQGKSILPTEPINPLLQKPLTIGLTSVDSSFNFDFDFDFSTGASIAEKAPSLAGGLHDLVARTVGIALFTPTKTHLEQREPGMKHRRCVSAPARTKPMERDDQPKRKRRLSA